MSNEDLDKKEEASSKKTPQQWAKYWTNQFSIARKKTKKWHKDGEKVIDRFLGKPYTGDQVDFCETQLNLFYSNITTLKSMLFGQIPKVEVDRTFADANDDTARVAGEIATRMLNQDIQDAGDDYATTLRSVLEDRLLPGLGTARVVYDFLEEEIEVPAVMSEDGITELAPAYKKPKITQEWVDEVYVHWKDVLWSPCRTYAEMRWRAFRSYMDYNELVKRFGEEVAKQIPLNAKNPMNKNTGISDQDSDPIAEAEVWEIWCKSTRTVFWFVEGMESILEEKEDYLELDEFWPDPPPLIANATTSEYMPRPDYALSQDLYREIDELETRITLLTRACKAVGVYDKSCVAVARMLQEGVENQLIPADNWAMFAEKGGMKGVVDWLPIEEVAGVVEILSKKQAEKIQQLYEVTGIADILRGASQPYEAAATSKAKVQFASIKVQALQEEFARFASDLQSKKLQIIQKHFQPECILYQSNIQQSMDGQDQQLVQNAIALLKNRNKARWRVQIRPETLAMADYAQLKIDRGEYITALSTFMQSAAPLATMDKQVVPILFQLLQWGLAGFKGSNQIEGVIDRAIAMYQKKADAPEQDKPDPEMIKAQAKMQELQLKMQMDQQSHLQEMKQKQEEHRAEMMQNQQEFQLRMAEMQQEFQMKMAQLLAEVQARKAEIADDAAAREHEAKIGAETREHELAVAKQMPKERKENGQ